MTKADLEQITTKATARKLLGMLRERYLPRHEGGELHYDSLQAKEFFRGQCLGKCNDLQFAAYSEYYDLVKVLVDGGVK